MKTRLPKIPAKWIWTTLGIIVAVVGILTRSYWWHPTQTWVERSVAYFRSSDEVVAANHATAEVDPHAGHEHAGHGGHDEATSLELSSQALRNVGLSPDLIRPIQLQTFRKSITVPAVIVERPGRTRVQIATPMTGVITHVDAVEGEAIDPGTRLFQIRLTHEDLVAAQTDYLTTLGELDVEQREIARLQEVTKSGAVPGKLLLNRQYAKDKLTSLLRAQREALRLHGLSDQQVERIASQRRLLRELEIHAPSAESRDDNELRLSRQPIKPVVFLQNEENQAESGPPVANTLILQRLDVHNGQSVNAGETLCILAAYDELYIEGLAFEQDITALRRASEQRWTVDAVFDQPGSDCGTVEGLEIAYLANQIDTSSRTLRFYVRLPNDIIKDGRTAGNRFIEWKYLPGQRLQLRVPIDEWPEQIVLPVDSVAREGAEYFVFQQNGDHFDRVPVHVKYRDQYSVVVENDGSLFAGDVVAMRGAHQMQMALKNKAGGGVDPYAGHSH